MIEEVDVEKERVLAALQGNPGRAAAQTLGKAAPPLPDTMVPHTTIVSLPLFCSLSPVFLPCAKPINKEFKKWGMLS